MSTSSAGQRSARALKKPYLHIETRHGRTETEHRRWGWMICFSRISRRAKSAVSDHDFVLHSEIEGLRVLLFYTIDDLAY